MESIHGVNVEIIIVNDSINEMPDIPQHDNIIVVRNPKNGVASARNYGAGLAKAPILLFMDDDMIITKENIKAVLHFHTIYSNCFLNLNWVYPPQINDLIKRTPFGRYLQKYEFNTLKGWNKNNLKWRDDYIFESDGITSQNLSVAKNTFLKCQGYNENFPYAGFEDQEFSSRIKKSGYRIFIDPNQMTYHEESDRLVLYNWLERKYRGGITRRIAVNMGFIDFKLQLNFLKRIAVIVGREILLPAAYISDMLFRKRSLDPIYFRIVNVLLSIAIYGGYFSKEADRLIRQLDE